MGSQSSLNECRLKIRGLCGGFVCVMCSLACFVCCGRSHSRGCERGRNSSCGVMSLRGEKEQDKSLKSHADLSYVNRAQKDAEYKYD